MADKTEYSSTDITNIAGEVGKILDDMAPFIDLKNHWPNAGKFELAQWLERIVDDRRNAIVAHAEHLRMTFDSLETSLVQLAKDFTTTDGENAAEIKKVLGDLEDKIEGQWDTWDENTEKDHHNYSPDDKVKNNSTDGDGYNDDLSVPIGD
ncbi:hypothetical protein [Actinophytocola oryzae]|uniref:Excreted virulence factor EspC (Type VII ESX diderm) n=1 Tax=Actinophytocola oryzae TaxID=502181 RepID=A0A4R7UZ11_9PSEU|nr:hypothetical protein [Actinophytocola oryzae]TDV42168.1 hypothetical protein CLV71_11838 [Actinophytocola oryzae]